MSFLWVSLMGVGVQGFEPYSTVFPGSKQGAGCEVEQLEHEGALIWDAGITDKP